MTDLKNIEASVVNDGLKHFIVAKMWVSSQDGSRPGVIRVSRSLPANITLKANTTLYLQPNNKREGKQDADYSVSVLLPTETSNQLIAAEQILIQKAKAEAAAVAPVVA